jgi:hypothetical protein
MAVTGLFEDESNRRTMLVWIALPLVLSLASWVAVQSGKPVFRAIVWLSVIVVTFFVWIAVFSIGVYYVPVAVLLTLAGFAPWPGSTSPPDPGSNFGEGEPQVTQLNDVLDGTTDK